MKKIGFVIPWYEKSIPGGAEMELRGLTRHLHERGIELDILTTCVKEFSADWNVNYYQEGLDESDVVPIHRFPVKVVDRTRFAAINKKFMERMPVSLQEEDIFLKEMVNSQKLYQYMEEHQEEYSLFVFIPYMFGTTYYGTQICPRKSVMIPCFHREGYAYMKRFAEQYSKVAGMIFNAKPEQELASELYDLSRVRTITLGIGMDTEIEGNAKRFCETYHIDAPYILYAGRKDAGKNVHTLIRYFEQYKRDNDTDLKLILIGGGTIDVPAAIKNEVIDLGFVPAQDKYDACSGALLLCQPSRNESFSLVIMESWLCGRPVLIHADCEVTKNFVLESNGGLYFDNYPEFAGCVDYITENPLEAKQMGDNGQCYVKQNFDWNVILNKCIDFFEELCENEENCDC